MRTIQLDDERLVSNASSSEALLLGNKRSIEDTSSLLVARAEIEILETLIAIPLHQPSLEEVEGAIRLALRRSMPILDMDRHRIGQEDHGTRLRLSHRIDT